MEKRFVIVYFLRALQLRMLFRKDPKHLEPVFLKVYNKLELQAMVKTIKHNESDIEVKFNNVSEEELFKAILNEHPSFGEQLLILAGGFMEHADITTEKVVATLKTLGLKDHYLETKPIADWDDTDHAAYWELSEKAGNFIGLYQKYSAYLIERDKYVALEPRNQLTLMGKVYLN